MQAIEQAINSRLDAMTIMMNQLMELAVTRAPMLQQQVPGNNIGSTPQATARVSKNTRKKLGPPNDENVKNIRRRSRGKSEMFLLLIYSWRPF